VSLTDDLSSATVPGDDDTAAGGGDAGSLPHDDRRSGARIDEETPVSATPVPDNPQPGPAAAARRPAVPDRPGRWQLTASDGSTTVHRVIDRNGELYVVRRGLLAVAIPVAHFEGDWLPLD
jgi:hypothetical protein